MVRWSGATLTTYTIGPTSRTHVPTGDGLTTGIVTGAGGGAGIVTPTVDWIGHGVACVSGTGCGSVCGAGCGLFVAIIWPRMSAIMPNSLAGTFDGGTVQNVGGGAL